jgi:outer membrane protein OmpA-like peptidoglycan-associated protein
MFAPPVARPKAMQPQPSMVVAQRPSQSVVSQAHMLQQSIGNRAMSRLLAQRASLTRNEPGAQESEDKAARMTSRAAAPSWDFSKIPVFPSGHAGRFQLAPLFPAPRLPGPIQAKLKVGAVNDPLEHEADRVADQVMRMPAPEVSVTAAPPQVSRKCAECEDEEKLRKKAAGRQATSSEAPASVHGVLRAPGQPLDAATRGFMEPRFGQDFSGVRVHTDATAVQSARDVNAHAYTVGRDIAFDASRFAPASHEGQRLLAHELTHVVQQSGGAKQRVARPEIHSAPARISRDPKPPESEAAFAGGAIAQPTIQRAPLCPGTRDSGEVTKSQSQAGVLAVDTSFDAAKESLSVHDFGIDQDSVPPTMTQSDDWRRMMSMILGDPTTHVAVLGFSDCIGTEQNNQRLRDRRADAVVKAMPAEAQAKVSPMFKGWWGSLTYLFPNDTAENRARNRMALIALIHSRTDSCDGLPKATNIDQFIFLVSCLEKRLGLTNAADAPKTLSVLRQLYFGNAAWSTARNRSKIWGEIITSQPWAPGNDPTPKLGAKLLSALQDSKDIKFDSSASSIGIDISHLLTGLDAMMNPQNPSIHAAGPIYVQTNVLNHALATWAGDVASAATNYTICVDFLKFSASYDDFFKDLAEDADLEGDIDAYAVWAALNSAPGAPVPLQLNLPVSEVLMQYYRLKNTPGGQGRATRFEIFANFYGANVKGRKMQNRLGFQQNIYSSVKEIAILLLAKQMKEVMQGNAASVGACAGGKPPAPTGQPASVGLGTLINGVATASVEMTERFTIWLEKRL